MLGHFLPWCPNGGSDCKTSTPAARGKIKACKQKHSWGPDKTPLPFLLAVAVAKAARPHGRQSQSEEFPSLKQKPRESSWRGWAKTGEASSAKLMANNPSLLRPWSSRPSASSHRVRIPQPELCSWADTFRLPPFGSSLRPALGDVPPSNRGVMDGHWRLRHMP